MRTSVEWRLQNINIIPGSEIKHWPFLLAPTYYSASYVAMRFLLTFLLIFRIRAMGSRVAFVEPEMDPQYGYYAGGGPPMVNGYGHLVDGLGYYP